jgi:hypothetical protein
MALSPDGSRLSITGVRDIFFPGATKNVLIVFDMIPLGEGKLPIRIGAVPVGEELPISVVDAGRRIVVAFQAEGQAPAQPSQANLLVIDATRIADGAAAVIGTITHGAGHLTLASDRRTLIAGASLKGGLSLSISSASR